MDVTRLIRSTYVGAPVVREYHITGVSCTPITTIAKHASEDLERYEAGCTAHNDCAGHMCTTPSGSLLVPQSLASRKGTTSNRYYDAAREAFKGNDGICKEILTAINKTKRGHMRYDVLGTFVNGSARLIIVPHAFPDVGVIAVPRRIAKLMRSVRPAYDDDGTVRTSMVDGSMHDGDWVIVIRPPSLTYRSCQPMRVRIWDEPVLGVHIAEVGQFHGDFDGDEMHIYPVYTRESIRECERWILEHNNAFDAADKELDDSTLPHVQEQCSFITSSNISMRHIRDMGEIPRFAKEARLKKDHLLQTGVRFTDSGCEENYVAESIRGMGDVARQQLSQGAIGYMSRVAKLAATCFIRIGDVLCVQTRTGVITLDGSPPESYGCPALRAVSTICSVAQQAALDAHRAGGSAVSSFDMIGNMISGGDKTVISFLQDPILKKSCEWSADIGVKTVGIITRSSMDSVGSRSIKGAYAPWVLRNVANPYSVCREGISILCNYYDIRITDSELYDLSHMMTYESYSHILPITSSDGMRARSLGWIDQLMGSSYSLLEGIVQDGTDYQTPYTMSSACLTGNFRMLSRS